jgi:hypothetical protein
MSASVRRRAGAGRWVAAVSVLALVAGTVGAWLAADRPSPTTVAQHVGDGPLYTPAGDELALSVTTGRPLAWGNAVYFNGDTRALRLRSARPIQLTPGLRVARVVVAGARRPSTVGDERRWPPAGFTDSVLEPIDGFEVPPESRPTGRAGVEVLFELVADRPGRYALRGVELTYQGADGRRYRDVMPDAIGVCALPRDQDPLEAADCPLAGLWPEGKVG